jgi:molybdopterin-guanine dinucleotide biosynthesis protein A
MEPLCAAYRKECDAKLRAALREGTRKTRDAVQSLRCDLWKLENGALFRNVNTPDDWERFLREQQPQ